MAVELKSMIKTESQSFEQIFHNYYPFVCRQLYYLVGNQSLAEDLAQETFLKLYQLPPADFSNIGGWLAKVATNLAYNHLRSEKSRQKREDHCEMERMAKMISFEEVVVRNQEVREVRSILKQLSARDRTCLLLKFSGYKYQEIATVAGMNVNSVGTILARAQDKFKKIYLEQRGGES